MYVNSPRYLLRKFCALALIKDLSPGQVLEVGCGAGDFCMVLSQRGFTVKGIDFSQEAIDICHQRLNNLPSLIPRPHFQVGNLNDIHDNYNAIFMFEVLEHIKDETITLKQVHRLLNPGGHFILSVPANTKWFGPGDRYAGHYRRYNKKELIGLLEDCGFHVLTTWAYGVPLANITEIIRNIIFSNKNIEKIEGTKQSGINRDIEYRFRYFLNNFFMYPFCLLQMLFIHTTLGSGFIVKAVKK